MQFIKILCARIRQIFIQKYISHAHFANFFLIPEFDQTSCPFEWNHSNKYIVQISWLIWSEIFFFIKNRPWFETSCSRPRRGWNSKTRMGTIVNQLRVKGHQQRISIKIQQQGLEADFVKVGWSKLIFSQIENSLTHKLSMFRR